MMRSKARQVQTVKERKVSIQEFYVSVTPVRADDYFVRIERVSPGVPLAEAQISLPIQKWLTQARQLMHDPLMGVLLGHSTPVDDRHLGGEINLVALGQDLYNTLFQGRFRESWMIAQGIAQNQRQKLRLRLGLKGSELPRLPWEVMHDGTRPLATGTEVLFSRYQPTATGLPNPMLLPSATNRSEPLRILMAIAAPSDRESLQLLQEAKYLQSELQDRSKIELSILNQPDRATLTQALEQGRYQVLHYSGHSSLGASGGAICLVNQATDLTEWVSGEDLAGLLVNNGIQMTVFNSCRGAYTATADGLDSAGERNLTAALVSRGIPGVLAMAERIPDEVALHLTRLFYRNLNQGYPIDLSVNRARQGLVSAYGSGELYWALPILYQHPEFDGYLTQVGGVQETVSRGQAMGNSVSTRSGMGFPYDPIDLGDDSIDEAALEGVLNEIEYPNMMDDDDDAFMSEVLRRLTPSPQTPDGSATEKPAPDLPTPGLSTPSLPTPGLSVQSLTAHLSSSAAVPVPNPIPESAVIVGSVDRDRRSRFKLNKWLLSGVGVAAIALMSLGWLALRLRSDRAETSPPIASLQVPQLPILQGEKLKNADTSTVTRQAIEQLAGENYLAGLQAVEALLDRQALAAAKEVIGSVPNPDKSPAILFLRGRLAWQAAQQTDAGQNLGFSVDDARRDWENAAKKESRNLQYRAALGFAYYAEGKLPKAQKTWEDALDRLSDETQAEGLNVKAGLALTFWKLSQQQSGNDRVKLLQQAISLRTEIFQASPTGFTAEELAKNWLWTEQMIRDWQEFRKLT
jgi:CHAT domain